MNQEETVNKILTMIMAIQERLNKEMVTKDVFEQKHNEVIGHIDGYIKLHQTLDIELVALRDKYSRLEERVSRVERKMGILV